MSGPLREERTYMHERPEGQGVSGGHEEAGR